MFKPNSCPLGLDSQLNCVVPCTVLSVLCGFQGPARVDWGDTAISYHNVFAHVNKQFFAIFGTAFVKEFNYNHHR